MRFHCTLILLLLGTGIAASAKPDSVLVRYPAFLGWHKIILNDQGVYLQEKYSFFKYMYSLKGRDTLSPKQYTRLRARYSRAKWVKQLAICDPEVYRIRNEGSMAITFNEVLQVANERLGKNNWFSQTHVFHWLLRDKIYEPNCYPAFKLIQAKYRENWLRQIDSVKTASKC